jgi:arsenate reductase
MSKSTIWHNPSCGTSRHALALLRDAGHEPQVIEYLKTGWDKDQLRALLAEAGLTPRQVLRTRGTPAEELGLLNESVSDEQILDAMAEHPILVERPLVRTSKGAVLARPADLARALL